MWSHPDVESCTNEISGNQLTCEGDRRISVGKKEGSEKKKKTKKKNEGAKEEERGRRKETLTHLKTSHKALH